MAIRKKTRTLGVAKVMKNLNKEVRKIEGLSQSGLTAAALFIRGEAQKLTPIVTGNLRNSAFVVAGDGTTVGAGPKFSGGGKASLEDQHGSVMGDVGGEVKRREPSAAVGFSAVYTLAVHENPRAGKTGGMSPSGKLYSPGLLPSGKASARIVWSRKGQWKFLETAVKNNKARILSIIKRRAKIR